MTVVGYDSLGSVICAWNREEHPVHGYVTSAVLTLADNPETAKTSS